MKTKLQQFKNRNQKRNSHLYNNNLIAGYDYVVCPVSGERLSMIKNNYIINVLEMKVEDYPRVQRICNKRVENIKSGLQQVDSNSGLTRYELGQTKARNILKQVDVNGLSGYARKGRKTRATHMSNIDELGRNGYRRQADNRLTTMLPNGLTVEQNAHKKQKVVLTAKGITRVVGASKISKKNLKPILEFLDRNKVKYYFDKSEYAILDTDTNNYYYYDLTIPEANIVVEYQSSAWHSNPSWDSKRWQTWHPPKGKKRTADEALQYDYVKARALYKHRGIVTHYIWEDSLREDLERILCLLKTQTMKS